MKYKVEDTTLHLQYSKRDKAWKEYIADVQPSTEYDKLVKQTLEDTLKTDPKVVENTNLLGILMNMPDRLPNNRLQDILNMAMRRKPIYPSDYDKIVIRYEPDPSTNFQGQWYTIKNNKRSRRELVRALLKGEDVIK